MDTGDTPLEAMRPDRPVPRNCTKHGLSVRRSEWGDGLILVLSPAAELLPCAGREEAFGLLPLRLLGNNTCMISKQRLSRIRGWPDNPREFSALQNECLTIVLNTKYQDGRRLSFGAKEHSDIFFGHVLKPIRFALPSFAS